MDCVLVLVIDKGACIRKRYTIELVTQKDRALKSKEEETSNDIGLYFRSVVNGETVDSKESNIKKCLLVNSNNI